MRNNVLRIALTSTNYTKKMATELAFKDVFSPKDLEIILIKAQSGVPEMPTNDEMALKGCMNRIACVNNDDHDFIVSMEGLVSKLYKKYFVYGWAVIRDCKSNRQAIGCSAKVHVPEKVERLLNATGGDVAQINSIVKNFYNTDNIANVGLNGVFTKSIFTRTDEFRGALLCALGFLLNDKNY